jgi:histidine decarboxylase
MLSEPLPPATVADELQLVQSMLKNYHNYLIEKTKIQADYPFNLTYDYSQILPFLKFSIINLGDPFIESNYKIDL